MDATVNETIVLSEELLKELGDGDENNNHISKKRKKNIKNKESNVCFNALDSAIQLSKSAQRKLFQIEERKAKELKRDTYYELLHKHDMESNQRGLLKSSKDIGQAMTSRMATKRLFHKQNLGLKLTDSEFDILYQRSVIDEDCDSNSKFKFDGISPDEKSNKNFLKQTFYERSDPEITPIESYKSNIPVGLNLLDVLTASEESDSFAAHDTETPSDSEAVSTSLGTKLLKQFQRLKGEFLKHKSGKVGEKQIPTEAIISGESKSEEAKKVHVSSPILASAVISPSGKVVSTFNRENTNLLSNAENEHLSLLDSNSLNSSLSRRPVTVYRDPDIQATRMSLPVCAMEQEIMESINENDVIILCGETGSGKSTQIPQFLYEAGYAGHGIIGITQPRRVAAICTASRVSVELSGKSFQATSSKKLSPSHLVISEKLPAPNPEPSPKLHCRNRNLGRLIPISTPILSIRDQIRISKNITASKQDCAGVLNTQPPDLVGYQIRFDASTIKDTTRIVFMTDGILLREISEDILLRKYSVIIIDEAHERTLNTDIIIGMLSRSINIRKRQSIEETLRYNQLSNEDQEKYDKPIQPIKLIIMSATLRVSDFQNRALFPIRLPPVVTVEARQYPVTVHFAKQTCMSNYLHETFKKVLQIHRQLPPGGILVFLTGKREILHMVSKLKRKLTNVSSPTRAHQPTVVIDDNVQTGSSEFNAERTDDNDFDTSSNGSMESNYEYLEDSGDENEENGVSSVDDDHDHDHDNNNDNKINNFNDGDVNGGMENRFTATTLVSTTAVSRNQNIDIKSLNSSSVRSSMLKLAIGTAESEIKTDVTDTGNFDFNNQSDSNDEAAVPLELLKPLILPLYAMLSQKQQNKIFQDLPPNSRLIVIATNVAETSITIPNIRYVVDCGRQKERVRLIPSGISKYEVKWISRTSAEQRKGRAGRTGPGHCYRLYTSAFFNQQLPLYQQPSILTTPLEDLVLQMKSIGIQDVALFPFPTPPSYQSLRSAQDQLLYLGALELLTVKRDFSRLDVIDMIKRETSLKSNLRLEDDQLIVNHQQRLENITSLGKMMSKLPLNPRFSKMLLVAVKTAESTEQMIEFGSVRNQFLNSRFVEFTLSLVAVLSEGNPFVSRNEHDSFNAGEQSDDENEIHELIKEEDQSNRRQNELFHHPHGDSLARFYAFNACAFAQESAKRGRVGPKYVGSQCAIDTEAFCRQNNIHYPTIQRMMDLRVQLRKVINKVFCNNTNEIAALPIDKDWVFVTPPTGDEDIFLRQVMVSGYCDHIARKAPPDWVKCGSRRKRLTAYMSCDPNINMPIYVHPNSNLYRQDLASTLPEYVIYESLIKNARGDYTYMTDITVIEGTWISAIASNCPLLKWSNHLMSPAPFYDSKRDQIMCYTIPKYGQFNWELPVVKRSLQAAIDKVDNSMAVMEVTNRAIGFQRQDEIYRWFARYLLEGKISIDNRLTNILTQSGLKENPAIITQMKPLASVSNLLQQLVQKVVYSRETLFYQLQYNPLFICEELQQFLKLEVRAQFRTIWKDLKPP